MIPRERVFEAMSHREADRVPLYLWVFRQPGITQAIQEKHGSFEAFCDLLSLDACQTFPSKGLVASRPVNPDAVTIDTPYGRGTHGNDMTLEEALEVPFTDPDDGGIYTRIREEVAHHKGLKGRAIFLQTPGVFEASNGLIGLGANMEEMLIRPDTVRRLYEKIARWNHRYIENAVEIGVDVIHVSDDWGMNGAMLFSPKTWWELVYPAEKITTDFARKMGVPLSLHCDGYLMDVLDGVVDLGFSVLHPVQASAGMDQARVKREFGDRLTIYGGLDVRTTLGRGDADGVRAEVRRLMRELKPGGGFLFCTSHMVQPGTPLEEVEMAYRLALEEGRYKKSRETANGKRQT